MGIFADWLKTEIDKRGWKQVDLAKAAGLTETTVSRVLKHQRQRPDDETLQAIARALGYPIEDVYRVARNWPAKRDPNDRPLLRMLIEAAWELSDEDLDELVRDYHSQTYAGQVADECWFTGAR